MRDMAILAAGTSWLALAAPTWPRPVEPTDAPRPTPPLEVTEAVCRPTFNLDGHEKTTGTAFLVETPGPRPRRLLVAAHHLFGLGGGAIPWRATPERVRAATCPNLDRSETFRTGPALAVEGAHAMGDLYTLKDIALLPVVDAAGEAHATPLKLADRPPAPGDPVWLVAQTFDPKAVIAADSSGSVLHRGRVLDTWGFLAFAYDDRVLNLRETSGAPVVNARGEVVGVNVGYNTQPNGALTGVADDLDALRSAVDGTEPP